MMGDAVWTPEVIAAYQSSLPPPPTLDELKLQSNSLIISQISSLESLLIRPMRELLSTEVTDKSFAQAKVDDIERQIQALRAQLLK